MTRLLTPTLYLRLASGVTVLYAAGHALGGIESWSPPGDTDVLQTMRTFEFDVMGATRTYMHFYLGFGVYITVLLLLQAVMTWQLASQAHDDPRRVGPMVAALSAGNLIGTFVVWRFFFVVPALFSLACAACLTIAYVLLRSAPRSDHPQGDSTTA
jgi:hypothetical protein